MLYDIKLTNYMKNAQKSFKIGVLCHFLAYFYENKLLRISELILS
jgi:hypothetical protein